MATLVDQPASSLTEVPDYASTGVPCPECGVYFADRTSMLCHMSKRHKHHESRPVNQEARPFDKRTDAKDGRPQCRRCDVKLCDFSSLRKRINERRCKVLFPVHSTPIAQPPPPRTATINADQGRSQSAPKRLVTHSSHDPHSSCGARPSTLNLSDPENTQTATNAPNPNHQNRSSPTVVNQQTESSSGQPQMHAEGHLPYFCRTHVQHLLETTSDNAAFDLKDRQWLRQHCALCSQWIACHTKVKQHYRLSRPTEFDLFAEDARRACCKFNTPASPCERCGVTVKAYRQHPSKCPALWQVCLMSLKLEADRSSHGSTAGDVRAAGRGAVGSNGLDGGTAPANRGKAPRTEQGKGRPGSQAPSTLAQSWRQGAPHRWPPSDPNVKALARLALQQETALKIIRQDYSWVLFVQPENQGPLPLLYAAAQKWNKAQEENATTTTLRTALFGCLIQTLHTGLKDIGSEGSAPFQKKAEEMKWLKDGLWSYQKWSPALGSLVADEARTPMPRTKLMEALMGVLPLLMQPRVIHRFHATRPLTGNMTGITTFQLDISSRASGHQQVWECLEAMTGLTALQAIGLQLRRDTLKQSPAAALVQQALADCS